MDKFSVNAVYSYATTKYIFAVDIYASFLRFIEAYIDWFVVRDMVGFMLGDVT